MSDLKYVRPASLDEAVALLGERGVTSRVLAGGTDLVNQLRKGEVLCDRVVDVAHIPELRGIKDGSPIRVGAAVTHAEIAESALLRARAPLLVRACRQIGSPQIRNVATIGGNVANAAACADTLPVLVCLEASAVVASSAGVERVPVAAQLPRGALILAFEFEAPPPGSRASFQRIGRRQAMAIARLSVAALGAVDAGDGDRVSLLRLVPGAAFARFQRATSVEGLLVGQKPTAGLIRDAGQEMARLFLQASGGRWSARYKEQAIATLTERALQEVLSP
ncbi:MAG: FAD binding domain-containing protein [Anaerolineae bacterium]|nr:FAD binding domain-containing protein [Anaerolineae bacterium]